MELIVATAIPDTPQAIGRSLALLGECQGRREPWDDTPRKVKDGRFRPRSERLGTASSPDLRVHALGKFYSAGAGTGLRVNITTARPAMTTAPPASWFNVTFSPSSSIPDKTPTTGIRSENGIT